jgi:hypothetical protein
MWSKNRFTWMALALMLPGCSSLPTPSAPPPLQASLRQPCVQVQPPANGSRAVMLRWSVDMARAYRECQSRHRRTVEAWPGNQMVDIEERRRLPGASP